MAMFRPSDIAPNRSARPSLGAPTQGTVSVFNLLNPEEKSFLEQRGNEELLGEALKKEVKLGRTFGQRLRGNVEREKALEDFRPAIGLQRAKIEGRDYFAPREAQATNPLVLQALQQSMAQQPMLAGFETQMAQLPQFQQGQVSLEAMPESKGAAKLPTGGGFSAFKDLFRQMTGQGAPEFDQPLADYGANYFDKSRFTPYSAPQQMGVSQMGGPQMGGMQGGLLGSLATKGQQQIAAGQAMNPTILKAKSV